MEFFSWPQNSENEEKNNNKGTLKNILMDLVQPHLKPPSCSSLICGLCFLLYQLWHTKTSGAYGPLVLAPVEGMGAIRAPCLVVFFVYLLSFFLSFFCLVFFCIFFVFFLYFFCIFCIFSSFFLFFCLFDLLPCCLFAFLSFCIVCLF